MLRSVDGRRTATVQSDPAVVQRADSAARLDMKLNPQDLENIAHLTLEHYNQHAEEFWEGTRNHDVNQNIAALLQYIESEPPFILQRRSLSPASVSRGQHHSAS